MKKFFANLEKISCNIYPVFYSYCKYYEKTVKREIELANITSKDKVLVIGSGSIPFTAIHVSKLTGANVTAVDIDKEAVEKSKSCIKKYNFNNITVLNENGLNVDCNNYDVIIIALQVFEKEEILSKIIDNGISKRVIVRQPAENYAKIYGELPKNYKPKSYVIQNMKTFKKSCMYGV
ncbi:conserved hypothetical protein [Methanococcus vannielii SB]|jgi:protein-L-isoaspartate O-methyltransferase|uniref:Alanine dehydrogenase/pyridine nucleotide transhydrogenase NAD(H)-binding domain-containing protein n=1 Tax=Methanococcus vannielii (strain ATCC 35089 / DSM 1224 / JCM 13029 / OCM 148 / SB) TaxID=406327 RepID=A6URG8_METVS|nr:nicotianamine synthase family protein [Methanococcus vannielii]ABR55090.1 conserved hypothetical protein [Methanococcus vannielii SB]